MVGAIALLALFVMPASAGAATYCVDLSGPPCDVATTYSDSAGLTAALSDAGIAAGDDVVRIGVAPGDGDYDGNFTYSSSGTGNSVAIEGSGSGTGGTVLQSLASSASETVLILDGTQSVSNLRIDLPLSPPPVPMGAPNGDTGLFIGSGAAATGVTVASTDGKNLIPVNLAGASVFEDGVVAVPNGAGFPENYGVNSSGDGGIVRDSVITGDLGINHSGSTASDTLTATRTRINAAIWGINAGYGTVEVDDALIDLGTSGGYGLTTDDFNNNSPVDRTIDARHLTIVGGGPGSAGVRAVARGSQPTGGDASVTLSDSVIEGPDSSILVHADNGHTATVTTQYSNYDATTVEENNDWNGNPGVTGTADHVPNNDTDVAPSFVGAGDYRLAPTSPLIDAGDPAAGGPALDLDGNQRVADGNCDGTARRDVGAFELQANCGGTGGGGSGGGGGGETTDPGTAEGPPNTTLTKTPKARTKSKSAMFEFSSSKPTSTFECSVDGGPFQPCSSPLTLKVKKGEHRLEVRARDAAGNVDPTPASFVWKVKKKRRR